MECEYRVEIEYANNGVYLVTLRKVNISPNGVIVADFESRSVGRAIQKAAEWIKTDLEFAIHA